MSNNYDRIDSSPAPPSVMHRRPIPSSGEPLPVIGCGTWSVFDVGSGERERAPLADVLRELFAGGGTVVDSSPMYGRAEEVAGDLLAESGLTDRAFVATKVWTNGRDEGVRQMERSSQRLRRTTIDLVQVHNLVDWRTHLATLRRWRDDGRVRYIGVTHYTSSAFAELESVMRSEPLDFVQLNYSLDDRAAEARLLPLAQARGIAVIVNRPLGAGALAQKLRREPLPGWADDVGCTTWPQLALKFIVAHPAVTCAIPATRRPAHARDNAAAGTGALPDESMRTALAEIVDRL